MARFDPDGIVYREPHDGHLTWTQVSENTGDEMDWGVIMYPKVDGEKMSAIYINMDSNVLKTYKSRIRTIEQVELAEKKYVSSVYFHTLFLFTIAKSRQYTVHRNNDEIDLGDFLRDVFSTYYSEFLPNFGTEQLMASLDL